MLRWSALANDVDELWDRRLRAVGTELTARATDVTAYALEAMRNGAPELFSEESSAQDVAEATTQNIFRFGRIVAEGGDPELAQLPGATAQVASRSVRRDVGLAPLLRVYSLGHERVWAWLFDRLASEASGPAELAQAADLLSRWLFAYVNHSTRQMTTVYEEERRAWLAGALSEQAEAAAAIVRGEERDLARASRRLRFDLARWHLGLCVWRSAEVKDVDPQVRLRRVVRQLAAVVGCENPLILPSSHDGVIAWLSMRAPMGEDHVAALGEFRAAAHAAVAFGVPGYGLDGFRRTHLEAKHAQRIARATPSLRGAIGYDDVAVIALASVDQEQACAFVDRVLGPLARSDEPTVRVAETLSVFLDERGSRTRAAARLHVHPNTVSYRVKRAEELLRTPFDRNSLSLRVALALLPTVRGEIDRPST